jgi:hypothetical protein
METMTEENKEEKKDEETPKQSGPNTDAGSGGSGGSDSDKEKLRPIVAELLSELRGSGKAPDSSNESRRAKEDRIAAEVASETSSVLGTLTDIKKAVTAKAEEAPVKVRLLTKFFGWQDQK